MFAPGEVIRSLDGAWRLVLNRPEALRFFNFSAEGFWRSFGAVFLVAPFYLIVALADRSALIADPVTAPSFNDTAFWWMKAFTLAIDWLAFPILLAALAGFIGMRRTYPAYIVARNWGAVLTVPPFALITLLGAAGLMSSEAAVLPSLAAIAFALRYGYVCARRALAVEVDVAVLMVILDFLVSLAVLRVIGRISGITLPG